MTYDNDHITEEITSEEQVKEVVSFCSKFVEAVVILDNYWFFTTSFSIFIHNNKIDDCADQSRVGSQKEAVSFTRKKTRTGRDYFELTTRFNSVELLSTSGFFEDTISNSVTAFLGSSIRDLPSAILNAYGTVSSHTIFIPTTVVRFTQVERLLNQYFKKHAVNKWMLISNKYQQQGFAPNHPLSFTSTNNVIQKAASLILKVFVNKTLFQDKIEETASNLEAAANKVKTASDKLIYKYITELNSMDELDVAKYDTIQLKKDMLFIYGHSLAGALKRENLNAAKKADMKYKPARANLFD